MMHLMLLIELVLYKQFIQLPNHTRKTKEEFYRFFSSRFVYAQF
jgi:hypothetical protein